jgi:hypothetical protein
LQGKRCVMLSKMFYDCIGLRQILPVAPRHQGQ